MKDEWDEVPIADKVRLVFQRHPDEALAHRYEAASRDLPEDPGAWLDMALARAREISDTANKQSSFMVHWIRQARRELAEGDLVSLRESMLHVEKQWEAAQQALWAEGVERQLLTAGKHRAADQREQREPEWERWRAEAARIQAASTRTRSKRELAAMVKKNLDLAASERSIRRRL